MTTLRNTNRLINESSPYLLQHSHNPVDWYPWGDDAFDRAKAEKRLVIISIGYSACHWCHVMEHESFEDSEVAELMNTLFVSIKVDREERPDIDHVYMNAIQILSGSGGWPLNVIALPDGRPVFGGTYFRKEQWISILNQVSEYYNENPEKTLEHATALTNGLKTNEIIKIPQGKPEFGKPGMEVIFNNIISKVDLENGGLNGAPKFPLPVSWQFLLHYYYFTGNIEALDSVTITLNKMEAGGIYDHIGGGFARYSTDATWHIPHFEKMLYDNAQLVSLYSSAYQATGRSHYRQVVYETLDFIKRELTSPEGLFYSALDADSEGEEGKYYVWTKEETDRITGSEASLFNGFYNVTSSGNWEDGRNILFRSELPEEYATKQGIQPDRLKKALEISREKLLRERDKRIRPGLDNKILTSWNALMIKGYIDAYRVFNEKCFLDAATRSAGLLIEKMKSPDNRIQRNYSNGTATINGFLDDYAFTIDAFISLYQATFNEKWIIQAHQLTEYVLNHFSDDSTGMFFYTSDIDPPLVVRTSEYTDNVMPSSNSAMAINLFNMGRCFYNDAWIERAKRMAHIVRSDAVRGGPYYANWDILLLMLSYSPPEVVIIGKDWEEKRREFDQHFLPGLIISGGSEEGNLPLLKNKLITGKTLIYVCRNRTCKMPVYDVSLAIGQLKS